MKTTKTVEFDPAQQLRIFTSYENVAPLLPFKVSQRYTLPASIAASGGKGQWRYARAHSDREQAELSGCERRHHGARRSGFLWRPQDGSYEGAR